MPMELQGLRVFRGPQASQRGPTGTPSLWSTLETTWSGCSPAHRSRRSPGTGGRASQTVRRHRLSSSHLSECLVPCSCCLHSSPSDVATKTDFNTGMVTALVSDTNNKKIRFLYVGQEQVGSFVQTSMQQPSALALAPNQATLIVSDLELHQLLTFNMADGKTSKFVGNGQRGYQDGATASFNGPRGLTFSPDGTYVCSPALTPMTSTCCRFLWLTQATMS
mmetsp:Transcript_10106/g.33646  ORF Transcript_10106/g.33646 Transcript_10106/m.33646 type:complete len:221 (+) Transcript_10106:567-1229(+)